MDKKLSIITPTLNRLELLKQTTDSILKQTYKNFEHIIVDDGSTDGTVEYILSLGQSDFRFVPVLRRNGRAGGNVCRNLGLDHARGEYLMFLDSDDLLEPQCIEERISCMLENSDLDFGIFDGILYVNGSLRDNFNSVSKSPRHDIDNFLHFRPGWQTSGPTWRREVLEKIGKWNESLSARQDWELSLRAILSGCKYRAFQTLGAYRWRMDSVDRISTSSSDDMLFEASICAMRSLLEQRIKLPLYDECKNDLLNFISRLCRTCPGGDSLRKLNEFLQWLKTQKICGNVSIYLLETAGLFGALKHSFKL